MSYVFSFSFFFTAAHFHLALVAASILILSPPPQNFHVGPPTFSLSFDGLPPFFSFSLSSLTLYFKFVDVTINLSLILQTPRIQKQFLLSVFVFIDFQLSLLHKTRVAMRFPAKITSSCIWVAIPIDSVIFSLFYIGVPVVRRDGRSVARSGVVRSRDYQILQAGQIYLAIGLRTPAQRRGAPL